LFTLSLLAAPLIVTAQPRSTVSRIGILEPGPSTEVANTFWEPFLHGLRDLGYVEGHNLRIAYRSGGDQPERLPALAAELARLPVDVLVTAGAGALAAKQATATIPIVFAVYADPVGEGLVASLARPGGNVTGLSMMGLQALLAVFLR
jgi:putative ABC transport system substrate-binding protein